MQTRYHTRHRCWLAVLLLQVAGAAQATPAGDDFPPPGLYRVDSESAMAHLQNGTGVKSGEDGATGNTMGRVHSKDDAGTARLYRGETPLHRCVKPAPTPAEATLAAAPVLASCRSQTNTVSGGALVMKAACASGVITTLIRKIDPKTWEFDYAISMQQPPGGPDVAAMRPMLENLAKNAPDTSDREQAARQLAQLPQMQKQVTQQQAALADMYAKAEREAKTPADAARIRAAAQMHGGSTPKMEISRKERWTRLAESCASAAPLK